jgi:hypothetical protein
LGARLGAAGKVAAESEAKRDEQAAAQAILNAARESRARFMRAHASTVYGTLTARRTQFVRIDEVCQRASVEFRASSRRRQNSTLSPA